MSPASDNRHLEGAVFRKLLRGGSSALIAKLATYPLGLLLTMLFTRLMSPAEVGAYFLALSLAMLASGLAQAGMATTMCKLVARTLATDNPAGTRMVLRTGLLAFALGGILTILVFNGRPGTWLISLLDDGSLLLDVLPWLSLLIVALAAVNYCCETLRGFSRLPAAALLDQQLLQRILLLAALVVPLFAGSQLTLSDVLRMTAMAALAAAATGAVFVGYSLSLLDRHGESLDTSDILRQAPAFLLIRVNNWILNSSAVWVVGLVRPLEETALYGAANVIALLTLAGWQVINAAIGPTIVTLRSRSSDTALRSVLGISAALATLPGLGLALILLMWGQEVLQLFFTPDYAAAYYLLIVLSCGRAISTIFGSPVALLAMSDHQDIVQKVIFAMSVLTLSAYAVVAEPFGAAGIAYVTAASAVLQAFIFKVAARRLTGISPMPQFSRSAWVTFRSIATQREQ